LNQDGESESFPRPSGLDDDSLPLTIATDFTDWSLKRHFAAKHPGEIVTLTSAMGAQNDFLATTVASCGRRVQCASAFRTP
jgi:hypothetical protein